MQVIFVLFFLRIAKLKCHEIYIFARTARLKCSEMQFYLKKNCKIFCRESFMQ